MTQVTTHHETGSREEKELLALRSQVLMLREALRFSQTESKRLDELVQRGVNHAVEKELRELKKRNAELEALFAALNRMLQVRTREDAYIALQDLVANLIGSEEMSLIAESAYGELTTLCSCGVEEKRWKESPESRSIIRDVLETGQTYLKNEAPGDITTCFPLRSDRKVRAVLVIFDMLPQKQELDSADLELMRLMEHTLGSVIEATGAFKTGETTCG